MNTIKLNIGLENNPYEFADVLTFVNELATLNSFRQESGEYNGEPERTFVASLYSKHTEERILKQIELLTIAFTQDCIAVKINDVGYLVYNPEYKGEKFEFNNEYFIEP